MARNERRSWVKIEPGESERTVEISRGIIDGRDVLSILTRASAIEIAQELPRDVHVARGRIEIIFV
jgi:hypothetical protein